MQGDPTSLMIWQNLGDYHKARVLALNEQLDNYHLIEIARNTKVYEWQIQRNLDGLNFESLYEDYLENIPDDRIVKDVIERIDRIKPDVILIVGITSLFYRRIADYARKKDIPVISSLATTYADRKRPWWKEQAKRWLHQRRVTSMAVTGERSHDYATRMGYDDARIWRTGNVVDNDHYQERADHFRAHPDEILEELRFDGDFFLYVGRLSPEKNLLRLLTVFGDYRKRGGRWNLVMVGSGPQRDELHARAQALPDGSIHFIDWLQADRLPMMYAQARCFVLPSVSEPWGLVINEAFASGIPAIVSRTCGCQPELCRRGVTGYDIDPFDDTSLLNALEQMSGPACDPVAMGRAARELLSTSQTLTNWAAAMADAVRTTATMGWHGWSTTTRGK